MPAPTEAAVVRIVSGLARRTVAGDHVLDLTWAEMGIDSLDLLELVVRCEDELGRPIPDREMIRWSVPRHVVDYLESAQPVPAGGS